MRRLPRLPRCREQARPRWQRIGIASGRLISVTALQGLGGFALGFAAIAVADTIPDGVWRVVTQIGTVLSVVVGTVVICVFVMWIKTRGDGRRRNPSINSQVHNLSSRALNWRFRRG